jgi:hypothetical protein
VEVVLDRMFSRFVLWCHFAGRLSPHRRIRGWGASAVSAGSFWFVFMVLGLNTRNAQLRAQTDQEFRFILRCGGAHLAKEPRPGTGPLTRGRRLSLSDSPWHSTPVAQGTLIEKALARIDPADWPSSSPVAGNERNAAHTRRADSSVTAAPLGRNAAYCSPHPDS